MNAPAYPEPIDWNAVHKLAGDLVRFLAVIDHRLMAQHKHLQGLEHSLHQARAQFEEEHNALHERLTEVLERDYRNGNPGAATAGNFSRDEALDEMEALVSSLWVVLSQQQVSRRRSQAGAEGVPALAAQAAEALFGSCEVDGERLARIVGDQYGSELARKVRQIRERLAVCAPTHAWDFAFTEGEVLRPHQEAWRDCPVDGRAQWVVRPAFVEGGRVIRRQLVSTC